MRTSAFHPLGYRFEISSPRRPDELRNEIRKQAMSWFEAKSGARGWVVGRFICLWLSAFDRYGPMAFAWISTDRAGSRIVGRAGSDLNGVLMLLILGPLLAFLLVQMIFDHSATLNQLLIIGGIVVVGVPLTLWMSHKDRREADPLVSFLRRAAKHGLNVQNRTESLSEERYPIKVEVSGRHWASAISEKELFEALAGLANGDFMVLAKQDEHYMQAASTPSNFIVEKREGGPGRHFRAELPKGETDGSTDYDVNLRRAFDVLFNFVKGQQPDRDLSWKHVTV